MSRLPIVVAALLIVSQVSAQSLILEYYKSDKQDGHAHLVTEVACASEGVFCDLHLFEQFNDEFALSLEESLESAFVVNMSFGIQKMDQVNMNPERERMLELDGAIASNKAMIEALGKFVASNTNKLFTVAAGNGFTVSGFGTGGIPLGRRYKIYPALYDGGHVIRVAALSTDAVDLDRLQDYEIAEYSNYSIFNVEVAAPVEKGSEEVAMPGTSFAAPYVARLASEMKVSVPRLTSQQAREILLRSCAVKNIDRAIEVSEEFNELGRGSLIAKLQLAYNYKVRNQLLTEIGDIMHVKCGGALVAEVAKSCLNKWRQQSRSTIVQSCLEAHAEVLGADQDQQRKLRKLWWARKI